MLLSNQSFELQSGMSGGGNGCASGLLGVTSNKWVAFPWLNRICPSDSCCFVWGMSTYMYMHTIVSWKSAHEQSTLQVSEKGGWIPFWVFPPKRSCHVYSDSMPSKQIHVIGQAILYCGVEPPVVSKSRSWQDTTLWTAPCHHKHSVARGAYHI